MWLWSHYGENENETEGDFLESVCERFTPPQPETRKCLSQSENVYAWRVLSMNYTCSPSPSWKMLENFWFMTCAVHELHVFPVAIMEDAGELLIHEVEKNEALYDKRHAAYKDRLKKSDIWKVIGTRLGVSGEYRFCAFIVRIRHRCAWGCALLYACIQRYSTSKPLA